MAGTINTRQQLQELQLSGVTEEGRELGRGAYGVVVEVMVNGLRCAAKKLHPILLETNSAERAAIGTRFVEECLQHSRLRHPNIVQMMGVYFPSHQAEIPLMVMELMEMSLSSCLENKPNLSLTTKNGILMDVARALLHLHNQNPPIIHRDLTANNVLLTSHLVAKISDLGVARIVTHDSRSCQLTKQPGTTAYMPPEASSPSYDTKLDVFSFGVLTLHVITNEWPLPDDEFVESPEKKGMYHRVSEADRRKKYIDEMGSEHLHKQLVCLCLDNNPDTRPSSQIILSNLESIASKTNLSPKLPKKDEAGDSTFTSTYNVQPISSTNESTYDDTSVTSDFAGQTVIGLYQYDAKYDNDMSFLEGEKMLVLNSTLHREWWLVKSLQTEEKGFIPSNYVESSYESQEWFFGMIESSDAEEKLHSPGLPKGAFLVREIASQPGKFTLSVRDQDDSVKHHDINREQNMFYLYPTAKFASLEEMVSYHKLKSHEPCCQLTIACPKSSRKTSETMTSFSADIPMDNWETERSGITFKQHLRNGCFGEFWQALWNGKIPVVVQSYTMASHDFLNMTRILKSLSHEKVIQLYAVCTQEKPFYIITEFLNHGSLLEYLSKGKGKELKLPELVGIAAQVACGMYYLESNNYIHRSLGARNIQVGDQNIVKIDNFSFARIVSGEEYIERCIKQFPIRWCAPESLEHYRFSIKSDVWSFGVLLMELITYGSIPYNSLSNLEVETKVVSGYHMPRPDNCPEELYETVLCCWKQDPQKRPSFDFLKVSLEDYIFILAN